MKGNEGRSDKPIYKKWWFWVILIIIFGGAGGALDKDKDEAAPAPAEQQVAQTQPKSEVGGVPEETADATPEPAAPAEAVSEPAEEEPAEEPTAEPATEPAIAGDWRAEIEKIAVSDVSATEKADAAALLKNKVTIGVDEEKEFRQDIVAEYKSGNYLTGLDDDLYALTNLFKASLVEDRSEGMPVGEFAHDFLQNTKYVYRGADTPDSDSVKSNEEQMDKALAAIQ